MYLKLETKKPLNNI